MAGTASPGLLADLEDLGISQAEYAQATRIANPSPALEFTAMDKNMKRLLGLVRAGCESWPGAKRDLESALEIGHGRLEECLDGTRELRVCHIVNLARLLKVKPSDFLRLAYADDEASAPNQLEDWIGEPKPPYARKKPLPLAPEHVEQLRELIREELAKAKG